MYFVHYYRSKRKTRTGKIKDYITLETSASVQLFEIFNRIYNKSKIIPSNLKLTPDMVLHWYTGDGYYSKYQIFLYTNNFSKTEVDLLGNFLETSCNINVKIYSTTDKRVPDSQYFYIVISSNINVTNFLKFIEKSNPISLSKAKSIFLWKFTPALKREIIN
ncbi:MAG: hypothetical protein ACW981_13210 [Candidatus Hodarchaeales archaeon]